MGGWPDDFDSKATKGYITKTSEEKEEFPSGMHRDTQEGKPRYDLIDCEFLRDWAYLMARGAALHGEENWRKARTAAELIRFKASAFRHFMAWFRGDTDEAHHVATAFNMAGAEMVKRKLKKRKLKKHGKKASRDL